MPFSRLKPLLQWALLYGSITAALLAVTSGAVAALPASSLLIGRDDWLFYRYELNGPADSQPIEASLDLIRRFNGVLAKNGVTLVIALVPIKMRLYAEHLPAGYRLPEQAAANYDRTVAYLRRHGVAVADLDSAMMRHPERNGEEPFYLRLDTHWTPSGALAAAEAIRDTLAGSPELQRVLDGIPTQRFKMRRGTQLIPAQIPGDLAALHPKGSRLPPDRVTPVDVFRLSGGYSLWGDEGDPQITLVGSSYSQDWTTFPGVLRHALQKDILDVNTAGDQGHWHGMEAYLRDDAYQIRPPRLLLWEFPERDLKSPPDARWRGSRYRSDNREWLLRAAALVETGCTPSPARIANAPTGTLEGNAITLSFDRPLDALDYLRAEIRLTGAKSIDLEASDGQGGKRRFSVPIAGDAGFHTLKLPLTSTGRGYTTVRLLSGTGRGLAVKNPVLCRLPDELLK